MAYKTSYGSTGGGSEVYRVFDEAGDWIGSAFSVDSGVNWFIRGLFRDTDHCFTASQTAIEQITFLCARSSADLVAAENRCALT
jgi:hypothetical protein